ncbi:tetratricopeptide repeat protein, partial [Actinosynnema sp. NPDC023658]|uniref:tetratricopeptide repeat protein n=1 Tax=Actinosynnema sp. NPDC023658 TaxID=3155465 RepID=UPI0033ED6116
GDDRVRAEPEAATEVARLCACLPLALRVAAANLAGRPTRTNTEYVAELRRGNLLGKLAAGYESRTAVRAAFDLSYRTLPDALRRLFRLLGLAPGPELTVPLAAQLADVDDEEAERLLNGLADAHLVEPLGVGRFRFHDLLRLYAAERADVEDTEADRERALRRLYDWYLHTANAAQRMCCPWFIHIPLPEPIQPERTGSFAEPQQALAWLKAERPNLVAMIVRAADGPLRPYSWLLADTLVGYFSIDRHYDDWLVTARAALHAATGHGDTYASGVTELGMGLVTAYFLADSTSAITHFRSALQHFRTVGAGDFEAVALNAVAMLHLHKNHGRLDDAVPLLEEALAIVEERGVRRVVMETLRNLGVLHHARGDLRRSADYLTRSLEVCREVPLPNVAPDLLARLGLVQCERGLLDEAAENLRQGLEISERLSAINLQSVAHFGLAMTHARAYRLEDAERHARRSLELSTSVQFQAVEVNCLNVLGNVEHTRGRGGPASRHFVRALALARQIGHEQAEVDALIGLAKVSRDDHHAALGHADQALANARRSGFRLHEGRALAVLAGVHRRLDEQEVAEELDRQARQVFAETGCDPREPEQCDPPEEVWRRGAEQARRGRRSTTSVLGRD